MYLQRKHQPTPMDGWVGDVEIKYSAQITSTFKSGIWNDGKVFNLFEGYILVACRR